MKTASDIPVDVVAVGDRFYKIGVGGICWIVQRVFVAQADGIPHVALAREDDLQSRTVISLAALLEEHSFRPDRRNPGAVNIENLQRRKTDWYPQRLWRKITNQPD
jgi:hypothetical protein